MLMRHSEPVLLIPVAVLVINKPAQTEVLPVNTSFTFEGSRCSLGGRVMAREHEQGSIWASVVAVVAVSCTMGVLFLPLAMR